MKVIAYEQESNRPLLVQIAIGEGTAFLSQICLEINAALLEKLNPDASDAFRLQKSDEFREQLFKLLLEDLQMDCASIKVPSLTPFYLISRSQVSKCYYFVDSMCMSIGFARRSTGACWLFLNF